MPVISTILEPAPVRIVHFSLRASAEQFEAWKQAAGKQPLSAWLRDAADEAANKQQNERSQ